jgi:hypothetical protein
VSIPLAARAYPVEWRSNVDVDRERQSSGLASPLDHASNAHPAERLAALIDEDVGRLDPVGLLLPLSRRTMMVRLGRSMSSQRRSQASETLRPCR